MIDSPALAASSCVPQPVFIIFQIPASVDSGQDCVWALDNKVNRQQESRPGAQLPRLFNILLYGCLLS